MGLSTVTMFKNINMEGKEGLKILDDNDMRNLQATLFEMLIDFHAFCKKNKISYTLAGGSSLGAIRHGGFIPWDDDVDLLITRHNYEKLKKCFDKEMGDKYWLHTPEKTKGYGLGFPRIRRKGTVCRSREDVNNDECGVYIDLFLMENTYDFKPMRYLHGFLTLALGFIVSCKVFYKNKDLYLKLVSEDKTAMKIFKKKILIGKMFSFLSLDKWTHMWNKVNKMCHNNKSKYVTVPSGRKHFFGEMYEREWACKMKNVDFTFEGRTEQFKIMVGIEKYFEMLYGDWRKIPKPEEIEKHVVLELKL